MATIALGALGTLLGGPLGGALGTLAGRQIDAAIIGGETREGRRLDDLTISTSSYGMPIAKHYGRMRIAGSIIWATDLSEDRETSGGGKGKPKTTSFSYSSSLAVALSSRPIIGIGRIWADGNLLRGSAGDLKTGGSLRIYEGHGDQSVDPLIAVSEGTAAPAFRGCAYVVFEDLQLEDFGNRVPALSFEVFADATDLTLSTLVNPIVGSVSGDVSLDGLAGYSYSGGALGGAIGTLAEFYPVAIDSSDDGISIRASRSSGLDPIILPEAVPARSEGEFGPSSGTSKGRDTDRSEPAQALRYYDVSRDYQAGVQRPIGRASTFASKVAEFPGALTPDHARNLVNRASSRTNWIRETLHWRIAELDPNLSPGTLVTAPGIIGNWLIDSWEWLDTGVELMLKRAPLTTTFESVGDAGVPALPADGLPGATTLRTFELPWDGVGASGGQHVFAAIGSDTAAWPGAALYAGGDGPQIPLGPSGRAQSVIGSLAAPLASSAATLFEPNSTVEIELLSGSMLFPPTDLIGIANGQNRLLVGNEILQFAQAEQVSDTLWHLRGLLRGRAGTEPTAVTGHSAGADVALINDDLVPLDPTQLSQTSANVISAIGRGDDEPVFATIDNSGASLRPLTPVHGRTASTANGDLTVCWTRRARGAWSWHDTVETPLNEEAELYQIGIGNTESPDIIWQASQPQLIIPAIQVANHSGKNLWVKQIGRASTSRALLLETLS